MSPVNSSISYTWRLSDQACVLFDLDGTLVDTAADFENVLRSLCLDEGIAVPSSASVHATVSSGARALLGLAFDKDPANPRFESLLLDMLERYEQQIKLTHSTLYPGMDRLLLELEQRGIPWGVVTNKPERFSKPLLCSLELQSRCNVLVCPDHVTHSKPHPEPLLLACELLKRQPACTVYVGDHPRDIIAGKAAGMRTIAAAYGYLPSQPAVSEWGADLIVKDVKQITYSFWPDIKIST